MSGGLVLSNGVVLGSKQFGLIKSGSSVDIDATYAALSTLYLKMDDTYTEGAGTFTTDSSPTPKVCQLGDGAGTYEPVFTDPGFTFDGSNDYMDVLSSVPLQSEECTFVFCFKPVTKNYIILIESLPDREYQPWIKWSSTVLGTMGGTTVISATFADVYTSWSEENKNALVCAYKSGDSDIYFNNELVTEADDTEYSNTSETSFRIGNSDTITYADFEGVMYHLSIYPFKFTSEQAIELGNHLLGS